MAAEASRAPSVRERESFAQKPGEVAAIANRIHDARKPAIERREPIINDSIDALEMVCAALERVEAVYLKASDSLAGEVVNAERPSQRCAADIWLLFLAANEGLANIRSDLGEVTSAFYRERRT